MGHREHKEHDDEDNGSGYRRDIAPKIEVSFVRKKLSSWVEFVVHGQRKCAERVIRIRKQRQGGKILVFVKEWESML